MSADNPFPPLTLFIMAYQKRGPIGHVINKCKKARVVVIRHHRALLSLLLLSMCASQYTKKPLLYQLN